MKQHSEGKKVCRKIFSRRKFQLRGKIALRTKGFFDSNGDDEAKEEARILFLASKVLSDKFRCEQELWIFKLSLGNAFVKIPSRISRQGVEFLSTGRNSRHENTIIDVLLTNRLKHRLDGKFTCLQVRTSVKSSLFFSIHSIFRQTFRINELID